MRKSNSCVLKPISDRAASLRKPAVLAALAVIALLGMPAAAQNGRTAPAASPPSRLPQLSVPQLPATAATAPPAAATPGAPAQNTAKWASQCVSESRQSPLECSLQQSAIVTSTGQVLASVTVRVPPDTHQPAFLFQVPVGLYLPAGVTFQIDDNKVQLVPLQTCDANGCYAGGPIGADVVAAMKVGKRFSVAFQNLSKKQITVPFVLDGFADGYQKIQ